MAESKSLRIAYGEALAELGAENDKIVVLDADLSNATMTNRFSAVYPDRFFDFGIAEANMACAAAGFAHEGLIPFISTFALFGAGRADPQFHRVCERQCEVRLFPFRPVRGRGRRQPPEHRGHRPEARDAQYADLRALRRR